LRLLGRNHFAGGLGIVTLQHRAIGHRVLARPAQARELLAHALDFRRDELLAVLSQAQHGHGQQQ
jgi:hypothetical protein